VNETDTVPLEVAIRPETPDDHAAIDRVVERAFGSPAEARLVRAIRASDEYRPDLSLVATVSGSVVGHVMISGCRLIEGDTDGRSERPIVMLSPLAVDPDLQGRGVGGELVRAVTDLADRRGEPLVVLEGDPRYYSRFGFGPAADHDIILPLPDWAPPEAAQVLRLTNDDPGMRGRVVYPASFDVLGDD
jgi:putative acetyltransferase